MATTDLNNIIFDAVWDEKATPAGGGEGDFGERLLMINLDCIPISAYCQYTGESVEAINKRLQRQFWIEGVHVLKVNGAKERWIDLVEVSKWARRNKMNLSSLGG